MEAPALTSLWGELLVVALLMPSRKAHAILYGMDSEVSVRYSSALHSRVSRKGSIVDRALSFIPPSRHQRQMLMMLSR
jgi:hypothetical protein